MAKNSTSLDPQWLDGMYNNRLLVPDHGKYLTRWAIESQQARETSSCQLDLPYGDSAGEKLDLFLAAQAPATARTANAGAPVLVFIHGGYWRSLDKADHSFLASTFTAAGACVVIPNYDLCPAVTIPEITMQMVKALVWTWRHIAGYGGDPSRITVAGHSAGGHLAAMLLACHWKAYGADLPDQLIKNALSISGLHDLTPIAETPFLKDALRLTLADILRVSPALLPRPAKGTLYSVSGGDESSEFTRQNALIQKSWGRKTVPVSESLPGLNHFSIVQAFNEPTHRLHQLAQELLGLPGLPSLLE